MNKNEYDTRYTNIMLQHQYEMSKVSHEIRNPVTLINSFLQLLVAQHPEIRAYEYWDKIEDNMDFLKLLLQEISHYNNSHELHTQHVNLYLFVKSIIDDVNIDLASKNVSISLIKETALPLLSIDTIKMKEVILNLLRNSFEALSSGGKIQVRLSCDGNTVCLQIQDHGSGISAEYIDTLFMPFVTHKRNGTGLGLAIAKNIVNAHHGTIKVLSDSENGTIFTINLPV